MKKVLAVMLCLVLLTGCMGGNEPLERGMELRAKLLAGGCGFDVIVTADYTDQLHTFQLQCSADGAGDLSFTVTAPESIAGITGRITGDGGALTFADTVLAFPLLTDDQISPVSAPWILVRTLRGGYLTSAGWDEELIRLTIDDSYEEDALQLDIWIDGDNRPIRAEILYRERRILTMEIKNFTFV